MAVKTVLTLPRRVHTTLAQVGGATGRINSANPNLQNIPVHVQGRHAAAFRAAFNRPAPGYVLVSADYSQVSDSSTPTVALSLHAALCTCACSRLHRIIQCLCKQPGQVGTGPPGSNLRVGCTCLDLSWLLYNDDVHSCVAYNLACRVRCCATCCVQVELRVVAALAQEQALQQAFAEGRDVHEATARVLLDRQPGVRRRCCAQ